MFGAVNLEDIAQPRCFRVLDALRGRLPIPVWHDDQQGTATAVLAGLRNALDVVGKRLADVRMAMVGMGAANVACLRLLTARRRAAGTRRRRRPRRRPSPGRADVEAHRDDYAEKWRVCTESNGEGVRGGVAEALRGADVCIAFSTSGPGVIEPDAVAGMASDAIVVFACANPTPEIWPQDARAAGARIVATGRSDFPNQLNNSLVFPGLFRGALDVRAAAITDAMTRAAAEALAGAGRRLGLHDDQILPRMDDPDVVPLVADAVAGAALAEGVARREVEAARVREAARALAALARVETAELARIASRDGHGVAAPLP